MPGGHPLAESSFGPNAEAYERGRPGWPVAAVDAVAARLGLDRSPAVLDLAAGTGKLTRLLVERFETVTAVEPADGMRAVLEREVPAARALDGTAEAIPLADAAVGAAFVAEAFHWFDPARAAAELARVVRPGGGVAVLYNRRGWEADEEPWLRELHATFEQHRLPRGDVDPWNTEPWKDALSARFGALVEEEFENVRRSSTDEFLAQYASMSVIAGLPPGRREAALAALRDVLERHGVREAALTYRTVVVTAALR
jgi:ubiquinone/menaquinone biosynthesis C-methylase UbiE